MSVALPHLLAVAKAEPDRVAVVWNNQELTYPAFVARIAAVRNRLEQLGLTPGRTAAVLIDHLVQSWIAVLALQSLGLTTIALRSVEELDALDLPGLDYLVTRAGEHFPGLAASSAARRLRRISIEPISPGELTTDLAQLRLPVGGGHILSTSGTTGVYKRVLVKAEQQEARTAAYITVLGAAPGAASYIGNLGLWTTAGYDGPLRAWIEGGAAVFDQRPERHLAFKEREISYARLVPPELEAVLSAPEGELPEQPDLQISVIGGALPWRLAEKAMARLKCQVFSILGSTEVGAISHIQVREPGDQLSYVVHPSRQVEVVDEAGDVLPAGEVGLLRVRLGPADADGYLNDEAATRAHFANGYFYPGDLAAFDTDGRLKLHGRANDVVVIRGDKIATLPMEQSLQTRLGATGVCILSDTEENGEDTIHIVVERDHDLSESERQMLAGVVPGLKPEIRVLDSLPRNDMGKVNRMQLRRQLREPPAAVA